MIDTLNRRLCSFYTTDSTSVFCLEIMQLQVDCLFFDITIQLV